jgi:hypothetical protein
MNGIINEVRVDEASVGLESQLIFRVSDAYNGWIVIMVHSETLSI